MRTIAFNNTDFHGVWLVVKARESKAFFFEKKNQKTFQRWLRGRSGGRLYGEHMTGAQALIGQKFFGSFFSKKNALLPLAFLDEREEEARGRIRVEQ